MSTPEFDRKAVRVASYRDDEKDNSVHVTIEYEKDGVGMTASGVDSNYDDALEAAVKTAEEVFKRHVETFSIESDETVIALAEDDELHRAFAINTLRDACYDASALAGWWDSPITRETIPTKLMLIVSEIGEAMEADRKDLMDEHIPSRKGIEVELADAMIRILDLAGRLDLDIGGAFVEKMAYNAERADHKRENRAKTGGKTY